MTIITAEQLAAILDGHKRWLAGDTTATQANLPGADLTRANLAGTFLADANLSCCEGLIWAQVGPIGTTRRTVTGVWQDGEVTLHAGCFSGSRALWDEIIAGGGRPWDWPADAADRLAAECTAAADLIQASIHTQLATIENTP